MNHDVFQMIKKYAKQLSQMDTWCAGRGKILVRLDGNLYTTRDGSDFADLQQADVEAADIAAVKAAEAAEAANFTAAEAVDAEVSREERQNYPVELSFLKESETDLALVLSGTRYCSEIAEQQKSLPASLDDMAQIVGAAAEVTAYDLCQIRSALAEAAACLAAGKYTITIGRSLFEAVTALEVLEKQAEVHLKAGVLGGSVPVSSEEAKIMRRNYLQNYSRAEHAVKSREGRGSDGQ